MAVVREEEERRPSWESSQLGKDQCALCKRFGHWKRECPKNKKGRSRQVEKTIAHVKED